MLVLAILGRAMCHFINVRVVAMLLPAVRLLALESFRARVSVLVNRPGVIPFFANLGLVMEMLGFSPIVLPVMRVHADVPLVRWLVVRAPDSLKVENIEVLVALHLVDQVNRNFVLVVCERAELAVFAGARLVRRAKLGFVLVRVVEDLHVVVSEAALVLIWTGLLAPGEVALHAAVSPQLAAAVFCLVVVVGAALLVVISVSWVLTRECFEEMQIQELADLLAAARALTGAVLIVLVVAFLGF